MLLVFASPKDLDSVCDDRLQLQTGEQSFQVVLDEILISVILTQSWITRSIAPHW